MKIDDYFSEADLEAIRAATATAEEKSAGEIVPYIVGRVDDHPEGRFRAALCGALGAVVLAGLGYYFSDHWGAGLAWITLPAPLGALAGFFLAALIPGIERLLIDRDVLDERVRRRAEAAFLSEEVSQTRDRTGILVFLALFEHRAVILADAGINALVEPDTWEKRVEELVAGIRAGRAAAALCESIARCGDILERRGVERRPDDVDELADEPRLEER